MVSKLAVLAAVTLTFASTAQADEKCSELGAQSVGVLAECVRRANSEIEVLKEENEMLKSEVCYLAAVVKADPPSRCKVLPRPPARSR
jgi:hypothetical protein